MMIPNDELAVRILGIIDPLTIRPTCCETLQLLNVSLKAVVNP